MHEPKFYRKKPIEIEAIQYLGKKNFDDVAKFVGQVRIFDTIYDTIKLNPNPHVSSKNECLLYVQANATWLPIKVGEWILKDASGFYPCQNDRFVESYEQSS